MRWSWSTRCFIPSQSVTFHTTLISSICASILKPFSMARASLGRFIMVYHEPWKVVNFPSKTCHEVWTDFGSWELHHEKWNSLQQQFHLWRGWIWTRYGVMTFIYDKSDHITLYQFYFRWKEQLCIRIGTSFFIKIQIFQN